MFGRILIIILLLILVAFAAEIASKMPNTAPVAQRSQPLSR